MNDLKNLIVDTIQSIDQTTELFYQQHSSEGYVKLDNTLLLLMRTMEEISEYKSKGNDIGVEINNLNQVLNMAMKAMEEKDTVMFSDILQYELRELLGDILKTL